MSLAGAHVVVTELPEPPPPSDALSALVSKRERVALRRPGGELAIALGLFAIWAALLCLALGLRADLPALPILRYLVGGLVWCGIVTYGVRVALSPAPGQVLPSLSAARIAAAFFPLGAAVAAVVFLVDAPGHSVALEGPAALAKIVHCLSIGLGTALLPLGYALLRSRSRLVVGAGWIGAVLGVASGALGALVLHIVCPVGGALHVVVGHTGTLVAGALIGAVIAGCLSRA